MLNACWQRNWSELGLVAPPGALDDLLERYAEPQRHYHTRQHLEECMRAFDDLAHRAVHRGEAGLALWFHDAVHQPGRRDNETRSAQLAAGVLTDAGATRDRIDRIRALILVTRHEAPATGGDAALVADADLAILGADIDRFAEYESQVRREYGWLDDDAYRQGRARVLRNFLERERVFLTPEFYAGLEARARENLRRSLARLGTAQAD